MVHRSHGRVHWRRDVPVRSLKGSGPKAILPTIGFLVLCLAYLLGAGTAFAQEVTGTICGQVVDGQGLSVPGATVTISSPQHISTEIRVTTEQGIYRVPLLEAQRTSIKASYGRYYKPLLNQDPLILLPAVRGFEEYEWNDLNGDLVFQDGEQGAFTLNGFQPNTNTVDPDLKNGYTNSFHIGVEHQLTDDFVFSVSGIFKREKDIQETIDIGRSFSAYRPIDVTNPIDNSSLTIFALRPEFLGSRRIRYMTNPGEAGPLFRNYNGLEIAARRRWRDGWQLMAAFNISEIYGNIGNSYGSTWGGHAIYDTPNSLIHAEGPLDLDATYQFKLQGSYTLPYDVIVSGFYQAVSGFPLKPPENFAPDPALGAYTLRYTRDDVEDIVVESFVDVAGVPRGSFRHDFRHKIEFSGSRPISKPLSVLRSVNASACPSGDRR